jgi:TPR repeat protein
MAVAGSGLVALLRVALVAAPLAALSLPAAADYADGIYAQNHISLETAITVWRKSAWQTNDFLSQVKLGDIYSNSSDTRYYDPVEAYVWYFLASRNRSARRGYWDSEASDVIYQRFDHARDKQQEILLALSSDERSEARDRIVYIQACRGAEGFLALGRSVTANGSDFNRGYDNDDDFGYGGSYGGSYGGEYGGYGYGRGGRDRDFRMLGVPSQSVMARNDSDALIYFHIADSMGNPLGRAYLNQLEGQMRRSELGARLVDKQARAFHYWTPPYEYYPVGNAPGGVPLSDECVPTLEKQHALAMAVAIPPRATQHALYFLGFRGPQAVIKYQASLPDEASGRLTASQAVRAIQNAALNGDADSQNTLGVMYAKGLGVVTNYVRAEYWFLKAADQRYPAALYHLGVLYKSGPPGIDQDLHKANDYMTNSAIAGFRPTMNQLGALLDAAARQPPHPGQN